MTAAFRAACWRLQPARIGDLHPAEARSPLVEGRIANAVLPAHIGRRQSGRVFLQHLDDLLFGKSALAHVRLPKERTLPKIEGIYGEQVNLHLALLNVEDLIGKVSL